MSERNRIEDDPTLLPHREAMSILPIDPAGSDLAGTASSWGAQTPDPAGTVPADTTDTAGALPATDADASGTEGGSVTSDDRSETFSSSDSASSET